ncbi:hypothetical protein [Haladaptatus sp. NG-SE-30]
MSKQAVTSSTDKQYERWKTQAEERNMSVSEWMECMIEAGQKKFDVTVELDETNQELRQQRNELQEELDRARDRISQLEDRLVNGERGTIKEYVSENPGATYDEIIQHVGDTLPTRITNHLNDLIGEELYTESGGYYQIDERS